MACIVNILKSMMLSGKGTARLLFHLKKEPSPLFLNAPLTNGMNMSKKQLMNQGRHTLYE